MKPLIYGILNVTPDSFFDGGRYLDPADALRRADVLLAEGADVIDIGAESTRPGSKPVPPGEQVSRIGEVVLSLVKNSITVSVDTRDSSVARTVLSLGAKIINDVSGLSDPEMAPVIAAAGASVIIMHSKGTPETMQVDPCYDDVSHEVAMFLKEKADLAVAAGIPRDRISIDPGIGFGKKLEHNLALLRDLPSLAKLGFPVMIGVSRKSFLKALGAGEKPEDRLVGSLAATVIAWKNGARLFRTHDVAETKMVLRVTDALSHA